MVEAQHSDPPRIHLENAALPLVHVGLEYHLITIASPNFLSAGHPGVVWVITHVKQDCHYSGVWVFGEWFNKLMD